MLLTTPFRSPFRAGRGISKLVSRYLSAHTEDDDSGIRFPALSRGDVQRCAVVFRNWSFVGGSGSGGRSDNFVFELRK